MPVPDVTLRALPYHEALAAYLNTEEPETWAWFDSAQAQSDYAEALRLDLLKQTYRLDVTAFPELAAALNDTKTRLGLDVPVTVYQSQRNQSLNASLYFLPGEAHIVLEGGVLQLLNPAELRGVLGHELAHYILWSGDDRRFLVTDRLAQAMANDPRAEPAHAESARLLRLYTEIYADRGALLVTGDPRPVIAGLIKIQTGLAEVDPGSYVQQADEVFSKSKARTEAWSHPEAFIRARAITLWAAGAADVENEITRMIEGRPPLDKLDLVAQHRLTTLTKRWLRRFLRPTWFQTEAVLGQARLYFPDFTFAPEEHADEALLGELRHVDASVRDYFCYLLLDFIALEPDLGEEPHRAALALTSDLAWDDRLEALLVKELKVKKRDAQRLRGEVRASTPATPAALPGDTAATAPTTDDV